MMADNGILHKAFPRVCLKNHFRNLRAPLCGIFYLRSAAVARCAAFTQIKSPTNWNAQPAKSLFQTHFKKISLTF